MASEGRQDALDAFAAIAEGLCESPIERRLFWALVQHPRFLAGAGRVHPVPPVPDHCLAQLFLQRTILDYRADFLIAARGPRCKLDGTIVECDGHDYHNRTKFQVENDRIRDRRLAAQGYRVLRFTGREISRDQDACADEIWACVAHACGWGELP